MCKFCEWKRNQKRRYFIATNTNGHQEVIAPLVGGIGDLIAEKAAARGWREVSFEEALPVWWAASDFIGPCPTDLSEGDWLVNYA